MLMQNPNVPTESYESFRHMMQSGYQTLKGIIHRNGMFVLSFSLFIAMFNFAAVNVIMY
jgi:hypothetical protein